MKRWILPADATEASELILEEADVPVPGPGEVRMQVNAAALNYRDHLILTGWYGRAQGRSLVPLADAAGLISAVGEDVEGWAVGDRVTSTGVRGWEDGVPVNDFDLGLGALDRPGVLAEHVILPAGQIALAPRNLDWVEAACLPIAGATAWNAVFGDHPVEPGDTMLTFGTGGVALSAIQWAAAAGAEVHVVVRRDDHVDALRAMGVQRVLNSTETPDWAAVVQRDTGGVRKVVDTLGVGALPGLMEAVGRRGEIASVGLFDLEDTPIGRSLLAKQIIVRGVAGASRRMHRDMVAFTEVRDLHPRIHRRIAFKNAPDAYGALVAGGIFGKIVVEMSQK